MQKTCTRRATTHVPAVLHAVHPASLVVFPRCALRTPRDGLPFRRILSGRSDGGADLAADVSSPPRPAPRKTYLPTRSNSRLTARPASHAPAVVLSHVCGMMRERERRAAASSRRATVSEMPSTQMLPRGMTRSACSAGYATVTRCESASVSTRDDLARRVHVALHEVAVEAAAEAHGALDVDAVAGREAPERRLGERLLDGDGLERARVRRDDGQARRPRPRRSRRRSARRRTSTRGAGAARLRAASRPRRGPTSSTIPVNMRAGRAREDIDGREASRSASGPTVSQRAPRRRERVGHRGDAQVAPRPACRRRRASARRTSAGGRRARARSRAVARPGPASTRTDCTRRRPRAAAFRRRPCPRRARRGAHRGRGGRRARGRSRRPRRPPRQGVGVGGSAPRADDGERRRRRRR